MNHCTVAGQLDDPLQGRSLHMGRRCLQSDPGLSQATPVNHWRMLALTHSHLCNHSIDKSIIIIKLVLIFIVSPNLVRLVMENLGMSRTEENVGMNCCPMLRSACSIWFCSAVVPLVSEITDSRLQTMLLELWGHILYYYGARTFTHNYDHWRLTQHCLWY